MYTFVFDIGKTNIKGQVIDEHGGSVWSRSCTNTVKEREPYPHFDVPGIWSWLKEALREAASTFEIHSINVSTHGACAVLLGEYGEPVLPVLDYEYADIHLAEAGYEIVRPPYVSTCSPDLGAGLNLGRQLWWLKQRFPDQFAAAQRILMYPQFWVYRLTGIPVSEITSLGCHTDLWEPETGRYSSLIGALGIENKLPPLVDATRSVGPLLPELARDLGLPPESQVYAGVHDSNASFARYLAAGLSGPFTVMSTGTWVVAMYNDGNLGALQEQRDMLANVNVLGNPVACARFMGGREFDLLCRTTGATADDPISRAEIQRVVDAGVYACPPFVSGSGPFQGLASRGAVTGTVDSGASLATLYLALVIDYQLDQLKARGKIFFGGAAQKNPLLCRLLAQLRRHQEVVVADDSASTILGAWCLTRWEAPMPACITAFEPVAPAGIDQLQEYRQTWRTKLVNEQPGSEREVYGRVEG